MRSPWISSIFRPGREAVPLHRARGGLARLLLTVLLPLVLGPLLTVALLLYRQAQADLTHQVLAQLTALSSLKEKQIDDWAFNRQADMNNLAKTPDVLAAVQAFILVEDPLQGEAQGQAGMRAAGQALQSRFDAYLRDTNNAEYFALLVARADTGEVVLASTSGQKMLGQKFLDEAYFRTARGAALVAPARYDPRLNAREVTIVAAAPLQDPKQGTIAVLMGIIPDDRLLDIIAPTPGLGSTGRAYVITGDGYELGINVTPDQPKPFSVGIESAVVRHENGAGQYTNQAQQRVVGTYRWLIRHEIALLVEQNVSEAYAPLTRAGVIFAIILVLAVVVSVFGVLTFTRFLTRPIQELTDRAVRMAGGDLTARVTIYRADEIGLLAQTFNSMVDQLRDLYEGLEAKVEARTRQLQAAAEVGRAATSILNIELLLTRALELIRERFGYYHASIFLLDDEGKYAFLRESTGEIGALLKARGHRLAVGSNSIIGWVTANRRPRVASDVGKDPVHFKNELLPDTRSEAAIPLLVGDRLIGALDVQSRASNAFTPADLEVLQILADQLAVAIENGRLFSRQQRLTQFEQFIAEFTAKIHRASNLDAIVETAAIELGRAFGAHKAVVRLAGAPPVGAQSAPDREASPRDNGQNTPPNGGDQH